MGFRADREAILVRENRIVFWTGVGKALLENYSEKGGA